MIHLFSLDSQVINKQPAPLASKDEDFETDNDKVAIVEQTIVKQVKTIPKQQVQKQVQVQQKPQSKKGLSFNQYLFCRVFFFPK